MGIGILGSVLPALPGAPLCLIAYIVMMLSQGVLFDNPISLTVVTLTALFTSAIDIIVPLLGAKLIGISNKGILFSAIGMILGIFLFPPFGIFIGLLMGAIIGELIEGKHYKEALKQGSATLIASVVAIIIKLLATSLILVLFLKDVYEIIR